MRRLTLALTAGLALGPVVAEPAAAGRKPKRGKKETPAAEAPAPQPKRLTAAGLVGADEALVKASLGEPVLARAEGAGAMWTYRLPDCALFVYFQKQGTQPLKVTGAAAGPLARGAATPETDACLSKVTPK